ncbi:hypothetical protein BDZ89DRAFT_1049007, partial [Hymenopellis radicata]
MSVGDVSMDSSADEGRSTSMSFETGDAGSENRGDGGAENRGDADAQNRGDPGAENSGDICSEEMAVASRKRRDPASPSGIIDLESSLPKTEAPASASDLKPVEIVTQNSCTVRQNEPSLAAACQQVWQVAWSLNVLCLHESDETPWGVGNKRTTSHLLIIASDPVRSILTLTIISDRPSTLKGWSPCVALLLHHGMELLRSNGPHSAEIGLGSSEGDLRMEAACDGVVRRGWESPGGPTNVVLFYGCEACYRASQSSLTPVVAIEEDAVDLTQTSHISRPSREPGAVDKDTVYCTTNFCSVS